METNSVYQNNDPTTKLPKSSTGKEWKELVSSIWKKKLNQPNLDLDY